MAKVTSASTLWDLRHTALKESWALALPQLRNVSALISGLPFLGPELGGGLAGEAREGWRQVRLFLASRDPGFRSTKLQGTEGVKHPCFASVRNTNMSLSLRKTTAPIS